MAVNHPMITCSSCQTDNVPEAKFCHHCGTSFDSDTDPVDIAERSVFNSATQGTNENRVQPEVDSTVAMAIKAYLVIERGEGIGVKFGLTEKECLIGRWDADNGIFPEVDLDRYDPEAKVSRRHAKVFFRDGQFIVEDLGSTNGTFLNRGRRLLPGVPQVLANDDEVIVGKTFLRFRVD